MAGLLHTASSLLCETRGPGTGYAYTRSSRLSMPEFMHDGKALGRDRQSTGFHTLITDRQIRYAVGNRVDRQFEGKERHAPVNTFVPGALLYRVRDRVPSSI